MDYLELLKQAEKAKKFSYANYSNFHVGAALLGASGTVYLGANVEGASYGVTTCAERTAFYKAITEGERKFTTIAIISDSDKIIYPCGICRQVMSDFVDDNFVIICGNSNLEYEVYTFEQLMPKCKIPL
ncbi:cytidine deaminase [Candidatus Epulonipiscium viviparus]|uniref:cytidine deaminase n=1 Tax=Candidatus Epulonipiscium viviparus TaxID=420336 RepID=UPI002738074F|nr:cytidine deaminase [Candidatus Epulopiscium viviparus]